MCKKTGSRIRGGITDISTCWAPDIQGTRRRSLIVSITRDRESKLWGCFFIHLENLNFKSYSSFTHKQVEIYKSKVLTCHKPHPNPHSHSNMLPCDYVRHDDRCTHNSTEDHPDLVCDGFSSSWWISADKMKVREDIEFLWVNQIACVLDLYGYTQIYMDWSLIWYILYVNGQCPRGCTIWDNFFYRWCLWFIVCTCLSYIMLNGVGISL